MIGAVLRYDQLLVATGSLQIEPGDRGHLRPSGGSPMQKLVAVGFEFL